MPCSIETASMIRAESPAGMYARWPMCAPTATNAASKPLALELAPGCR